MTDNYEVHLWAVAGVLAAALYCAVRFIKGIILVLLAAVLIVAFALLFVVVTQLGIVGPQVASGETEYVPDDGRDSWDGNGCSESGCADQM